MHGYTGTAGEICFKVFNRILIVLCSNHGNFLAINLFHLITNILSTGDALSPHNSQQFTTYDKDNDETSTENCAELHKGAFWYKSCYNANLNGKYLKNKENKKVDENNKAGEIIKTGVVWYNWKDKYYTLKRVEMKIKPNKGH